MAAENNCEHSEESDSLDAPARSGGRRDEWCPERIAAQQDDVLERLDQLDQDILNLIAEFTTRLRGEEVVDEKSNAA